MGSDQQPACLTSTASALWFDRDGLRLNENQGRAFDQLQVWLKGSAQVTLAGVLLGGRREIANPKEEMQELVDQILKDFPVRSSQSILQVLSRIVRRCNEFTKLNLPLPEFSVRVPPAPNPFTSDRWGGLLKIRRWREGVLFDIARNPNLNDLAQSQGRVLASAVLFGGLVSRPSLEAFYNLLPDWYEHADMADDTLAITWAEKGGNYRRWFPDALTAVLILRLPQASTQSAQIEEGGKQAKQKAKSAAERLLLGYLRRAIPIRGQYQERLPELIDAALLDLEVRIPRALTEYAAGHIVSHSLRPKAWRRLNGKPVIEDDRSRNAAEGDEDSASEQLALLPGSPPNDSAEDSSDEKDEGHHDPEWLKQVRGLLRSSDPAASEIRVALKRAERLLKKSDNTPVLETFAGFAKETLQEHSGKRLNTVRTRVIAVAKRLPALLAFNNPAALSAEALQGAYQQILEDASSENQRQKLAGHLRAFHRFLKKTRFVGAIDEGEVFASANEDLTVDANLILEDEYLDAKSYLKERKVITSKGTPPDQRVCDIAGLLLMLGFRCGLRRMEALKLRRDDLNERDPAELLIRPWEQRRLKTPNATRKIPLYALLSAEELDELRKWKELREIESKTELVPSPYLFALHGSVYTSVPENLVFPLIHEALRKVTKDSSLHFHHLRHSFCSLLFCALLYPPNASFPEWLRRWGGAMKWLSKSGKLHRELYGNSHPTRRQLYALSRLLGHSSPVTGAENYNHFFDVIFAAWRDSQLRVVWKAEKLPLGKPRLWIAASGLPDRTVRRVLDEESPNGLVRRLWFKMPQKRVSAKNLVRVGEVGAADRLDNVTVEIDHLWLLIHLGINEKIGAEDLSHRFSLDELLVKEMLAVAREVEKCIGTRAESWSLRMPREGEERETFSRFAPALWELISRSLERHRPILKHYLDGVRSQRNGLEFLPKEKALAKKYLEFLDKLKVGEQELLFLAHAPDEAGHWELWRDALKLKTLIIQPARPISVAKAKKNVIGIKVVTETADKYGVASERSASYGMRYLLTMAGVWVEAQSRFGLSAKLSVDQPSTAIQ